MEHLRSLGPLAAAGVLLLAGAVRLWDKGAEVAGGCLLGAGLVAFGVWVAQETRKDK